MAHLIMVKRDWGIKDTLNSSEHKAPTRTVGKSGGSHIDELVTRKEAVILCDGCVHKFNARTAHYRRPTRFSTVRANCDDCRQMGFGTLFITEETVFG